MILECVKTCHICGKRFIGYNATKYCGLECSRVANRDRNKRFHENEKVRKRKANSNETAIVDIAVEARKAGMSYGQYVAKMGL